MLIQWQRFDFLEKNASAGLLENKTVLYGRVRLP